MSQRPDRPSVRSRATLAAGIAALGVIAIAARMPAPQAAPAAQPSKAAAPAATDSQKVQNQAAVKPDSMKMADSSMASMPGMAMPMPAPAPVKRTGPGGWPVDEKTGQTLINGVPVVGRVFVQKHTDGIVKYASVKAVRAIDAMPPLPPIVKASYTPAKGQATRRIRTGMVQSTLWLMDNKRSAKRERMYGPTTPASTLTHR